MGDIFVCPHRNIPIYMNTDTVGICSFFLNAGYSEIGIDHFYIGVTEIVFVSIDEMVVPVFDSVVFNSIAA